MDDFVAYIPKLKYKRSDGSQVYGFVYPGKRMQTHTVTLARGWDGDEVAYNPGNCFGCGVCIATCPQEAISLEKRK